MLGDQIRMLGDWPIRHLFDETVLAYERSAHVRDMVVRGRIVIGPAGALEPADGCAPSLDPEHRLTGHARSRSSSRVLTRTRQLGSALHIAAGGELPVPAIDNALRLGAYDCVGGLPLGVDADVEPARPNAHGRNYRPPCRSVKGKPRPKPGL